MPTIIFSDQMQQPYSEWVTECLRVIGESSPTAIGIVALCPEGQDNVTGYWKSTCADVGQMAQEIQSDFIDRLVEANFSKYLAAHGIMVDEPEEDTYDE